MLFVKKFFGRRERSEPRKTEQKDQAVYDGCGRFGENRLGREFSRKLALTKRPPYNVLLTSGIVNFLHDRRQQDRERSDHPVGFHDERKLD